MFFKNVYREIKKTKFPSKKEFKKTFNVVMSFFIFSSVFIFLIDSILGNLFKFIYKI